MKARRILSTVLLIVIAQACQGCGPLLTLAKTGDLDKTIAATEESAAAAKEAIDRINAKDERSLGQAASLSVIQQNGGLILEEELNQYLNEVGNLVALEGKRSVLVNGNPRVVSRRVFVGVLDSPNPNAFSLPGGYILVSRGLLESLGSESELAWVLGHEIAHADGEDGLNALKTQVAAGAFVTGGVTDFKNSKFFAKMTDGVVSVLLKKGWDSKAETTADAAGLAYSTAAGYDAEGAQRVLRLLNASHLATVKPDAPPDKTHATPEERWKKLSAKVAELQKANNGAILVSRYEDRCIARLAAVAAVSTK